MILKKTASGLAAAALGLTALTSAYPSSLKASPVLDTYAAEGYKFYDTFESDAASWEGRGGASVRSTLAQSYAGESSLSCTGRSASWNGAQKPLDTAEFVPGTAYSFSVNAMYETGGATENFKLTMQYKDASGKAVYSNVASAIVAAGDWVQLANESYTIPEDATDLVLYVETEETTTSFFIDDAAAASDGVVIEGAGQPKIRTLKIGDVTFDEKINVFDIILERRILINGTEDKLTKKASDIDGNGATEIADLVLMNDFVLGRINEFPKPPKPDNPWDDYQETAEAKWIDFYKSSIKNMGNVDRLAAKLEAAEQGEKLTLAYLGGSITEGTNYSTPYTNYIKNTFAKGQFKEVNAGLSGTSSVVGLVRCEQNVLSSTPDIVFLEFSVNDHEDILYKKCFESLVKKILSQPNDPAVIILINRSKGGFSSQKQMAPIGENFNVPVISMDDALSKAFNNGLLQTGDYFTDEYHPHAKGGQLVADCLAYFTRQAMKTENRSDGYVIPTTTVYGTEYESCVNVDPKTLGNFNAGSFKSVSGYGGGKLPFGYENSKNGNTPMTFTTEGKGFILVFKANSTGMGNVIVTVNGKETKISGNKQYTWGGPDAELGYFQPETGELNVSIKMENPGSNFTIWGVGLIK